MPNYTFIKKNILLPLKKCSLLFIISFIVSSCRDKIIFFNVGEGHCTLVHKEGQVPLLIDAGSRRNKLEETNLEETERLIIENDNRIIQNVTDNIINSWGGGPCSNLNVILTHKDKDHVRYVPAILASLRYRNNNFTCNILLGGKAEHYKTNFLASLRQYVNPITPVTQGDILYYSANLADILQGTSLGFLSNSSCISHLFLPKGGQDPNSWSIVTRIELNNTQRGFSALITGDATNAVQKSNLRLLGTTRHHELKSNIFFYPHHGAKALHKPWIRAIDPEIVVISAGKFNGKGAHPKAQAIESLFWQGEVMPPLIHPNQQLELQLQNLQLGNHNRLERIWNYVDPHNIVYYGDTSSYQNITRKLPVSRHAAFYFKDGTWYTGEGFNSGNGWGCALTNIPIYTTHTAGTIVCQADTSLFSTADYETIFVDSPSETDRMVKNLRNTAIEDVGDFELFYNLSHEQKRQISLICQRARSDKQAEKFFFLCFVIIPTMEHTQRISIDRYRERNILNLLDFFLETTGSLDFNNSQDLVFFNRTIDMLFCDASSYDGIETITSLQDRQFLFKSFFTGDHLHDRIHREDLFYLYYTVYSILEDYREDITINYLQNLVEGIKNCPFRKKTDVSFQSEGLEHRLCQIINMYTECNDDESYYSLDLADLGRIVNLFYTHRLSKIDTEILGEMLSVLPDNFTVDISATLEFLIHLLPQLEAVESFDSLTSNLRLQLMLRPNVDQLELLDECIMQLYPRNLQADIRADETQREPNYRNLPVRIDKDIEETQRQFIHVILPKNDQPGRVEIHRGLKRNMMWKEDRKGQRNEDRDKGKEIDRNPKELAVTIDLDIPALPLPTRNISTIIKTRTGLQLTPPFQAALFNLLPIGYELGAAYDDGDCFFDALAQWLNKLNNTDVNTVKYLRMLCHDFYSKNKALVDSWNEQEYGGIDKGRDDYYMIQYTTEECERDFKGRSPIWGRPWVEGKILCRVLNLRCMCVEILEDPATKEPVVSYYLVTPEDYRAIIEEGVRELVVRGDIPILVNEQHHLHFVPLCYNDEGVGVEKEGDKAA